MDLGALFEAVTAGDDEHLGAGLLRHNAATVSDSLMQKKFLTYNIKI